MIPSLAADPGFPTVCLPSTPRRDAGTLWRRRHRAALCREGGRWHPGDSGSNPNPTPSSPVPVEKSFVKIPVPQGVASQTPRTTPCVHYLWKRFKDAVGLVPADAVGRAQASLRLGKNKPTAFLLTLPCSLFNICEKPDVPEMVTNTSTLSSIFLCILLLFIFI